MSADRQPIKLNSTQRRLLDSLEKHVRSARNILFTINILCGFYFILILHMLLGWQAMRPSASHLMFLDNVSLLATYDVKPEDVQMPSLEMLTETDRLVAAIAVDYIEQIPGADSILKSSNLGTLCSTQRQDLVMKIREQLKDDYANRSVWEKEESLASCAERIAVALIADSTTRVQSTAMSLRKFRESFLPVTQNQRDKAVTNARFGNPRIGFAVKEILDRFRVNEETRGRRVAPREYHMPIFGLKVQLEDISFPLAIILLFLTAWLHSATNKIRESVVVFQASFEQRQWRDMVKLIANAFFFLEWFPNKKRTIPLHYRRQVIALFMTPYFVVIASVFANFYELFLLDLRGHGSLFFAHGTIVVAMILTSVLMLITGGVLAHLGWRLSRLMHHIYWRLRELLVSLNEIAQTTQLEKYNRSRISLKASYYWILGAPILIIGSFVWLRAMPPRYMYDYFLNWWESILLLMIIGLTGLAGREILRKRARGGLRAVTQWTFLSAIAVPCSLLIYRAIIPMCTEQDSGTLLLGLFFKHPFNGETWILYAGELSAFIVMMVIPIAFRSSISRNTYSITDDREALAARLGGFMEKTTWRHSEAPDSEIVPSLRRASRTRYFTNIPPSHNKLIRR